jgi:DNA-binding transcriptional MocR family regulator
VSVPDERSPIIVEDDALRDGFTQIPNIILRSPVISLGGKLAYATLLSYAWGKDSCFPGQERMARDMGVSKRSVIIFLQHLVRLGLISINRRGMGKTNIYTIHRLTSAESAPLEVQKTTPTEVQNLRPKNTQGKEDPMKKTKSDTAASGGARLARPSPLPPTLPPTTPETIMERAERGRRGRELRGF